MGGRPKGIGDFVELLVARALGRNLTPIQGCAVQIVALVVFAFMVWALFASGLFIRLMDPFVQWYTSQMDFGPTPSPGP